MTVKERVEDVGKLVTAAQQTYEMERPTDNGQLIAQLIRIVTRQQLVLEELVKELPNG